MLRNQLRIDIDTFSPEWMKVFSTFENRPSVSELVLALMPEGAMVVGVAPDGSRPVQRVFVCHPSFPQLSEGDLVPVIGYRIEGENSVYMWLPGGEHSPTLTRQVTFEGNRTESFPEGDRRLKNSH